MYLWPVPKSWNACRLPKSFWAITPASHFCRPPQQPFDTRPIGTTSLIQAQLDFGAVHVTQYCLPATEGPSADARGPATTVLPPNP